MGSVCYEQRDQHPVQPVPDDSSLLNTFGWVLIPTVTHLDRSMKDLLSLKVLLIGVVQLVLGFSAPAADDQTGAQPGAARIAEIERDLQGRLGVSILDTANGRRIDYHATDRFPMCSTFKFLLSGAVLQRVISGRSDSRLNQFSRSNADTHALGVIPKVCRKRATKARQRSFQRRSSMRLPIEIRFLVSLASLAFASLGDASLAFGTPSLPKVTVQSGELEERISVPTMKWRSLVYRMPRRLLANLVGSHHSP